MANNFETTLPQNVKVQVSGDELVIRVDLSKNLGRSASGKTSTVATTGGFFYVPTHPGVMMALNVNRK